MATVEELERINWRSDANWQRLLSETRALASATGRELRSAAQGVDWLSTWWVGQAGAVGAFQRRRKTVWEAMRILGDRLQSSPSWLSEAQQIVADAGRNLSASDADLMNTLNARRVQTAKIESAFGVLLEAIAGVRTGLRTGEVRRSAAAQRQETARSQARAIRNPWTLTWGALPNVVPILLLGAVAWVISGDSR